MASIFPLYHYYFIISFLFPITSSIYPTILSFLSIVNQIPKLFSYFTILSFSSSISSSSYLLSYSTWSIPSYSSQLSSKPFIRLVSTVILPVRLSNHSTRAFFLLILPNRSSSCSSSRLPSGSSDPSSQLLVHIIL